VGAHAWLARVDLKSDAIPTILTSVSATARLARAEGDTATERRALRRLQRLAADLEFGTWSCSVWPADLAVALGPCDEARKLAERALVDARARGLPGEIGLALRAQALVDPTRLDIERLRTAATELERSELALEHARTLVDLGAALRRRGHRREARQPLGIGLERAFRCGATALVTRAQTELRATGARPRRLVVSGRDALTPSERRIALLAAEGRSNQEIAQALFVTTKTVETHLGHTYRKLDITSRTQLTTALVQG
jgi:DNA-binding CsgD family transcriptional regulator